MELWEVSSCWGEFTGAHALADNGCFIRCVGTVGFLKRDISIRTRFPFRATVEARVRDRTLQRRGRGCSRVEKPLLKLINEQPHIALNSDRKKTLIWEGRERRNMQRTVLMFSRKLSRCYKGADLTGVGDAKQSTGQRHHEIGEWGQGQDRSHFHTRTEPGWELQKRRALQGACAYSRTWSFRGSGCFKDYLLSSPLDFSGEEHLTEFCDHVTVPRTQRLPSC